MAYGLRAPFSVRGAVPEWHRPVGLARVPHLPVLVGVFPSDVVVPGLLVRLLTDGLEGAQYDLALAALMWSRVVPICA